jgi:hypothetical protein
MDVLTNFTVLTSTASTYPTRRTKIGSLKLQTRYSCRLVLCLKKTKLSMIRKTRSGSAMPVSIRLSANHPMCSLNLWLDSRGTTKKSSIICSLNSSKSWSRELAHRLGKKSKLECTKPGCLAPCLFLKESVLQGSHLYLLKWKRLQFRILKKRMRSFWSQIRLMRMICQPWVSSLSVKLTIRCRLSFYKDWMPKTSLSLRFLAPSASIFNLKLKMHPVIFQKDRAKRKGNLSSPVTWLARGAAGLNHLVFWQVLTTLPATTSS